LLIAGQTWQSPPFHGVHYRVQQFLTVSVGKIQPTLVLGVMVKPIGIPFNVHEHNQMQKLA
jgi:hypothetical protein